MKISEATGDTAVLKRNGRQFWSGSFDTRDGHITEVHPYRRAENVDFHHSFYFSDRALDNQLSGAEAFFWVQDGELHTQWRNALAPAHIRKSILDQIEMM